ncbi:MULTISPECIES: hypothetical protein [Planktothricoides]|uniref:Nudix hydrolase domain-containing protein n=2 Tax=Planktothricoides raciborskii TaxID=132608 RepID=A0AAU8JH34_9CYAN|nr:MULTISPECIES: hypothetical protein [Planktothricoides]MBD2546912.1 hypothetical protein [Planktothricoides raciborskii FACHB-1370]MBD2584581.1 hypothetical protein [Planktothricoides raciborskii FACHB-1261]
MNEPQTETQPLLIPKDTLVKLPSHKFYRQTFMFYEMLSILLWGVTRISYDVKCLTDGVRGRSIQPSGEWDVGTIRLLTIVGIKFRTEETRLEFDCLTKYPPTLLLPDTAVIQSDSNLVCREPAQVGSIVRELKEELQAACVETTDFLVPTRLGFPMIEFLEPGKEWRQAEMRLDLEISFKSDNYKPGNKPASISASKAPTILPLGEQLNPPRNS